MYIGSTEGSRTNKPPYLFQWGFIRAFPESSTSNGIKKGVPRRMNVLAYRF